MSFDSNDIPQVPFPLSLQVGGLECFPVSLHELCKPCQTDIGDEDIEHQNLSLELAEVVIEDKVVLVFLGLQLMHNCLDLFAAVLVLGHCEELASFAHFAQSFSVLLVEP